MIDPVIGHLPASYMAVASIQIACKLLEGNNHYGKETKIALKSLEQRLQIKEKVLD